MPETTLIAVDIGNSRLKLGAFDAASMRGPFPEPVATLAATRETLDVLQRWPPLQQASCPWRIASVNRPALAALRDWIQRNRPADPVLVLEDDQAGIAARDLDPRGVGIDRLLDARAANVLRAPGHAAVVVDLGSAITVDLVDTEGAFRGGAILPGIGMSARALHEFTDLLPLLNMQLDRAAEGPVAGPVLPHPIGRNTSDAMRAGLFWGAVGAIRELHARLAASVDAPCDLFLTGGAAAAVADQLGPHARYIPHMALTGIALESRDG